MAETKEKKSLKERFSKVMQDLAESNVKNGPDCPGCRASTERLMERFEAERANK